MSADCSFSWKRADVGRGVSPLLCLLIAVGQREKGPAGEEVIFHVPCRVFHAPFFMGASDIAHGRVEEIMSREVQEAAIELDAGAEPGENDAAKVVVAYSFRHSLEGMKGVEVSREEVLEALGGE
jgi:hypothetical protein